MFTLIQTSEDLRLLNEELLECHYVALDTEFRRTSKENIKLALLQVNDAKEVYLIDCLKIEATREVCSFLSSPQVKKIFHSCKEDMEALYSWTNFEVSNVYDTQVANSLLGGVFSISYQGLVEDLLGLRISKDETRTNWLRRPLTEAQLSYAVSDVLYLIDLYKLQKEELQTTNKLDWLEEELNQSPDLEQLFESQNNRLFRLEKKDEKEILFQFDKIVKRISKAQEVNPTLFFSKQNQKTLLDTVLYSGTRIGFKTLTKWRTGLIKEPLTLLLKSFGVT